MPPGEIAPDFKCEELERFFQPQFLRRLRPRQLEEPDLRQLRPWVIEISAVCGPGGLMSAPSVALG